jgi:anti-anti-sigma factor
VEAYSVHETTIPLPRELVIRTAHLSRELLAPHFDRPAADVVLDGSAVAQIDAAGLQILLSCDKAASAAGVKVTIAPCSAVLARTLELAGVARRFAPSPAGGAP